MADSTTVLIKHNLNVDNIEEFRSALEKVLDITIEHTIIINNDEATINSSEKGWLLVFYDFPDDVNIWLYENIEGGREISFGRYYANIAHFCQGYMSQWFAISYYLDKMYPNDETDFLKERTEIYKVASKFGSDECILLNGSRLDVIAEDVSNGVPLLDAVAQYEEKNPIELIQKPIPVNGFPSQTNHFYNSRHKILVKLLHELDENRSYVDSDDWYDTILIDDFRDLKNIAQK
jgi:hypothetical protein